MAQNINGVIFQFFHWYLDKDDSYQNNKPLWVFLKEEANHFREIGIDAVWIPPAYKGASGENSSGYDAYDRFDLGEFNDKGTFRTKYGTKQELHDAINALHGYKKLDNGDLVKNGNKKYIQVYGDIVLNHQAGGDIDDFWQAIRVDKDNRNNERWEPGFESGLIEIKAFTKFNFTARAKKYSSFTWKARHFDSVDSTGQIRQYGKVFNEQGGKDGKYIYRLLYNESGYEPSVKNFEKWVSLEKGNFDYLQDSDFDYGRFDVREEMKYWGEWFTQEVGLDGLRLDAIKHITAGYIREWVGHIRAKTGKSLFTLGEYIAGETRTLHNYLTEVTASGQYPQDISLFDFPLRFLFQNASWQGEAFDLRTLNYNTLMAEQPTKAVTFVENHDYQFGREFNSHVREWFKPLAYAFILLRDHGYPCVFFADYYGSHDKFEHQGQPSGREYLDLLLKLRKQFALGEERFYGDRNIAGWVRMGNVPSAKGAMSVVINNSYDAVKAIRMNTGRFNKRFYHLATIKLKDNKFLVAKNRYDLYGDKAEGLWADQYGWADFLADGGTAAIWIEDGVGLT
ncbi:alpha-amylase (plasmid) [Nostoc sp. NIES-2111]|nr:alpha-amylase [Nostoc sp. NIES-2111]